MGLSSGLYRLKVLVFSEFMDIILIFILIWVNCCILFWDLLCSIQWVENLAWQIIEGITSFCNWYQQSLQHLLLEQYCDILELLFLVEGLVLLVKLLEFLTFWHESSFRTQFIVIDKLITIIMNDTHISYRKPSSFRRTNNPLSSCNKPFWIFKNNFFFHSFFPEFLVSWVF